MMERSKSDCECRRDSSNAHEGIRCGSPVCVMLSTIWAQDVLFSVFCRCSKRELKVQDMALLSLSCCPQYGQRMFSFPCFADVPRRS